MSKYQITEITPVLIIAEKNTGDIWRGYLEYFAVFQKLYLFIPQFHADPLMMFRGKLDEKHWLAAKSSIISSELVTV
jgi:hypothetical protein